jgi:hypothetical protein
MLPLDVRGAGRRNWITMTVAEFAAVLARRAEQHLDEELILHATMPDGTVFVGEITGVTDIGAGEGFAVLVAWLDSP